MPAGKSIPIADTRFVNEVRLHARHWAVVGGLVLLVVLLAPPLWKLVERFETGPDYRIQYALSRDYWLYQRHLQRTAPTSIVVLGDSVVWGEYVLQDGTLPHFLNRVTGQGHCFVNGGVNGLFPLAQEGLVRYFGDPLHDRKVILHCNLLWMTSPKADLSTDKEEQFNHAALVPQFFPRIPCYRADAQERLCALIERESSFVAWVSHLQNAYFGQQSILKWTLEEDGGNPPRCPNAYKNPLRQITLSVPSAPGDDPQRGPKSARHKPWSLSSQGTTHFDWVALDSSLQWRAFQRVIGILQDRGNDVLVILGPFNEHLMAEENRPAYHRLRDEVAAWLQRSHVPHIVPETLPSTLYADASHPLTEGYDLLAKRIFGNESFQKWLTQQ